MNVKELIELLQKEDPEDTVRIHGNPVWFVESKPYYHDGYAAHVTDNPRKYIYEGKHDKVEIHGWSEFAFIEMSLGPPPYPDFETFFTTYIDMAQVTGHSQAHYKQWWAREYQAFLNAMQEVQAK